MKAGNKAFRHEWGDVSRREIYHGDNEFAQKVGRLIQICDLGARLLAAYFRSEINSQHISWFPRFRKGSRFYNSSDSEFNV